MSAQFKPVEERILETMMSELEVSNVVDLLEKVRALRQRAERAEAVVELARKVTETWNKGSIPGTAVSEALMVLQLADLTSAIDASRADPAAR